MWHPMRDLEKLSRSFLQCCSVVESLSGLITSEIIKSLLTSIVLSGTQRGGPLPVFRAVTDNFTQTSEHATTQQTYLINSPGAHVSGILHDDDDHHESLLK